MSSTETSMSATYVRVALFDGGWLLHRSAHALAKRRPNSWVNDCAGLFTGWVFETAVRLKCRNIAVLFDSDSSFRKSIYPDYKIDRGGGEGSAYADGHSPYDAKPGIMRMLRVHNVPFWEVDSFEADDLFSSYVNLMPDEYKAFLIAKDKDMLQLIRSNVSVYIPPFQHKDEVFITENTIGDQRYGLSPKQFLDYQTLIGDKIDSIPSIIKPAKALKLLQEHSSLRAYFQTDEGLDFWNNHQHALTRNRKLVRLSTDAFSKLPNTEVSQLTGALAIKSPKAYSDFSRFAFSRNKSLF